MANGSNGGSVQKDAMKGFSMLQSVSMVVFFLAAFFLLMLVLRANVPGISQARNFVRRSIHAGS